MDPLAIVITTLGGLFIAGLATDLIARRTALPRVSLLILVGFVVGPAGLDVLPSASRDWFDPIATVTLMMIGFLLGGTLTRTALITHGRTVVVVSLGVVIASALTTTLGLLALGAPLVLALLLGAVAPATDPIATRDVIVESGRDDDFTRTLLGIVAIDDAWGLVFFSVALTVAVSIAGNGETHALVNGLRELFGAVLLGLLIGAPMAWLTGRLQPGEPTLAEALGAVLLCGGLAMLLEVSPLLAAMVMGCVVTNLAQHHRRPFHAIEGIEWPFRVLFFVLAGASFDVGTLQHIGLWGAGFVTMRVAGRWLGGWIGGVLGGLPRAQRHLIGLTLLPQAGVAIGMGLIASQAFPEHASAILSICIGSTLLFELLGPVVTRIVIGRLATIPK